MRTTGTGLAARNRLTDFRLRLALAALYGTWRRVRSERSADAREGSDVPAGVAIATT